METEFPCAIDSASLLPKSCRVRISATIEWKGGSVGWCASALLPNGIEIAVNQAHNLVAARRRLLSAASKAGVRDPELSEDLRIPKHLAADIERVRKLREEKARATAALTKESFELAQRLLTELNLTEREVAEWIGISHTHLANLMRSNTVETGELPGEEAKVPPQKASTD